MRFCRACEYTSKIHRDAVEAEVLRLSKMKGVRLCSEEEQLRRLEICGGCDRLDMNGVCLMCGCYVRIRALTADGRCPSPKKLW